MLILRYLPLEETPRRAVSKIGGHMAFPCDVKKTVMELNCAALDDYLIHVSRRISPRSTCTASL
jgi:hypothetical protein